MADPSDPVIDPTPSPVNLPPDMLAAFATFDSDFAASKAADSDEKAKADAFAAAGMAHDQALAAEADAHQKAAQSADKALAIVKQYLQIP